MKRFERSNGLDTALYKNYLEVRIFVCFYANPKLHSMCVTVVF